MIKVILFMIGAGAIYYISPLWMVVYLMLPATLWILIKLGKEVDIEKEYPSFYDEDGIYSWTGDFGEALTRVKQPYEHPSAIVKILR